MAALGVGQIPRPFSAARTRVSDLSWRYAGGLPRRYESLRRSAHEVSGLFHSDDYLLELLRGGTREIRHTPSVKELNSSVGWSVGQTIIARWGSYATACEAVGP